MYPGNYHAVNQNQNNQNYSQNYNNGYQQPLQPPFPLQQQQPLPPHYAPPPGFHTSPCTGQKKALLIGINYVGQNGQLKGCINDVRNMIQFLSRYNFHNDAQYMVVLTEDQPDPRYHPTRANILSAMRWLVGGAQPGDSLLFHYSGHGGQVRDQDGDEADGYDSCIYPLDHRQAGPILDDEINACMVRFLPPGVRLTAVFDCCHSGTGMDLPYDYASDGSLKRSNNGIGEHAQQVGRYLMRGNTMNAMMSAMQGVAAALGGGGGGYSRAEEVRQRTRASAADVIMFSGCKDSQTSADTFVGGWGATGAMSYALIRALSEQPQQTYLSLLAHIRAILMERYSQKPQLSSGYPMDMNAPFLI